MAGISEGERIQNCQNEDEALDVTVSCAKIRDKLRVTWELKPIAPRRPEYAPIGTKGQIPVRAPLRLALVIDVSCSMEEPYGPDEISKLEKVKLFIRLLLENMPDDDDFSIVTFGTTSTVVLPLTKMDCDGKELAFQAIDKIILGGVTNLGAGICTALEQFSTKYIKRRSMHGERGKSRYQNDNILLFTDGMANEGITDADELIKEMRKRIDNIRKECTFASDYTVKLCTLGTGGFHPEMLYDLGQEFNSDAFYFLEEGTNIELNLMKPILLREHAMVSAVTAQLTTLNNVTLEKMEMTNEYERDYNRGISENTGDVTEYFIHDIAADMRRQLYCVLSLPKKHKKLLKNKDVMTLKIRYRDRNLLIRSVEKTLSYADLPLKDGQTEEKDLIIATEQYCRTAAQKTLDSAADSMKMLKRAQARAKISRGTTAIRAFCEDMGTLVCEETLEYLLRGMEPIIVNLEHVAETLADLCVRWDDAWARLKAISSSLGRQVPTATGVYMTGQELFVPPQVDESLESLVGRLRMIYAQLGLSTDTIDSYRTVVRELQEKLAELEEDGTESRV